MSRFYLDLIPQDQRVEHLIKVSDFETFQKSCLQTEYGYWVRPMKSLEEKDQRYSFLLGKLNRPFYFVNIPNSDSGIRIVGRLEDMKEILCVSLVLDDGIIGDNRASNISSEFTKKVLQLPNINSQVLDTAISFWKSGSRDAVVGKAIISHPLFNQFNAKDMIGALFKKPMPSDERLAQLAVLLNSNIYSSYVADLFPLVLSESSNFIDAGERFLMVSLLVSGKNRFDEISVLNFAMTKPDQSKDYSGLYLQLSKDRALEEQFRVLSKMLRSDAPLPKAEEYFLEIWKQNPDDRLRDAMTAFAQSDMTSSKWLSRETVYKVTAERLSRPYSAKGIQNTLSQFERTEGIPLSERVNILRLAGAQENFDMAGAEIFIDTAWGLHRSNPSVESEITQSVVAIGTRFKGNDAVLTSYLRYLNRLRDKRNKADLVQKLLPDVRIEEKILLVIAHDIYELQSEIVYSFLETLLLQSQITAAGLADLVGLFPPKVSGHQSVGDRKILTLIANHPKATDKVKEKANQSLNPVMKYVEDPANKSH